MVIQNKKIGNQRAQAQIITVILIILIVIVAMLIVWNFVRPLVARAAERISLSRLKVDLDIESAYIDDDNQTAFVQIKRGVGKANLTALKFIFTDSNGKNYIYKYPISGEIPDELESKVYNITAVGVNAQDSSFVDFSDIVSVGIAFVVRTSYGGEVTSGVKDVFGDSKKENIRWDDSLPGKVNADVWDKPIDEDEDEDCAGITQCSYYNSFGEPECNADTCVPGGCEWISGACEAQGLIAGAYYVSTTGDDSSNGNISQPFQTIQKCADVLIAGDTCYIRAGTYRETITPANSGNALDNITFKAYPGETVTISGADLLTGAWTIDQGSIYQTTMNWDLGQGKNQIFVDGQVMMEARWPNADDVMIPTLLNIDSGTAERYIYGDPVIINDADLTQPAGFWNGAIVHAIWGSRYHAITGIVTSSSPGSLQMSVYYNNAIRGDINSYGIYYITGGTYNALDKEDEWFYDSAGSTLYFWAPGSVNPSTLAVEAKKRDYAFDLNGKSYINIEGLDVFASTIITDVSSHHITIDNINAFYVTHYTIIDESNMGVGAKGVRDTGIILDGHDNIIKNSEIAYSAGNGVSLIGDNNTVHNCSIHNVNYVITACAAVQSGGVATYPITITENNRITYSKLYNTGGSIVRHDGAENIKILHNEMYNSRRGWEPWDLGATYVITTDGKGAEIAYNKIHDIRSMGIYLDNDCSNFNIHHNVIWNIELSPNKNGIHTNTFSINNKIHHNTIVGGRISTNDIHGAQTMEGTEIKNNIYSNLYLMPSISPMPIVENNIATDTTNPLFVDPANDDFHLQEGSPAIDAGQDLGFTEDIDGIPVPQDGDNNGSAEPDIGAYEYGVGSCDVPSDCSDRECNTKDCASNFCVYTPVSDGISCTDDGVFCTGTETCQGGSCESSGSPCGALEICHESGQYCEAVGFSTDYVGYWRFEGNADDESIYNNDGVFEGSATIVTDTSPDARGQVVDFDGSGGSVRIADSNSLDVNEITVLAWVYVKDEAMDVVAEKGSSIGAGWSFSWNAAPTYKRLRVDAQLGGVWQARQINSGDLRNQWHQVGWTLQSPDQLSWIKDGSVISTISVDGLLATTIYDLCIGGVCGGGNSLNGLVDDVMIYGRALNESEIQDVYCGQGGIGAFC